MTDDFTPRRHVLAGPDAPQEIGDIGDFENALAVIETDLFLDGSKRRAICAGLIGLGWRQAPHVAEHLAWLLLRETDEMAACHLHRAMMATHPEGWTLFAWNRELAKTTPFPLLRMSIIDDLMAEAAIDAEDAEDRALLDLLDKRDPAQRALLTEHRWLMSDGIDQDPRELIAMLRPEAPFAEKSAALRVMRFVSDPDLREQVLPALIGLFRVERHAGLSLGLAEVLERLGTSATRLDMIAFFIRAWHEDGIAAAAVALKGALFDVEAYLRDEFGGREQRPSALTDALLAAHAPARLPRDGRDVADALAAISTDATQPFAAFAATALLRACHQPSAAGERLVIESARAGTDPEGRALAIRVLGRQPRALLSLLAELKALAVAPDTDPRIRRAAFHALVNTNQSGLPVPVSEMIGLYLRYLREAPYAHFGDAVHGSDVAEDAASYIQQLGTHFGAIPSETAREAALHLVEKAFGFGIDEAFEPYWPQVIQLMLQALDEPGHDDLHYRIFWNMLHEVAVPEPAASTFAAGLKDRLARLPYGERSRGLIEAWLSENGRA